MTPLVSMLTPTLDRPATHEQLYKGFRADTWPNKELVILDESRQPSPFFSRLNDPRVRYHHEPGKPRIDGVTRIGAARNRLTRLARGAYFEVRDDDDLYDPGWTRFAMQRLGSADLLKLTHYKLLHEATGLLFLWRSTEVADKHWAILGDAIKRVEVAAGEMDPEFVDKIKRWYGFSIFAPRRTFERFPFPEEGTEDIKFIEDIEAAGGRIVYVEDAAEMILHVIGSSLSSHAYPDRLIGAAGSPSLRAAVGAGMMAAMQGMRTLPEGQTIHVQPGVRYAILAAVDKKYSLRNITLRARDGSVTLESMRDDVSPSEFGVAAPAQPLRLVFAIGEASAAKKLLWKAPGYLSAFEKSHIVKAWTSAVVGAGYAVDGAMQLIGAAGPSVPSLTQLGLQPTAQGGLNYATSVVNAELPPGASEAFAQGIAAAGGWGNLTEQQQTQAAEQLASTIADAALLGTGVVLQIVLGVFGLAGEGPGCYCPGQAQAAGSYPCPNPFSPAPIWPSVVPGSFQDMCNQIGTQEWLADASCAAYMKNPNDPVWVSPSSSFTIWIPMLAVAATAWNNATDTSGPGQYDVDGLVGFSGQQPFTGSVPFFVPPTVPPGKVHIVRTVLKTTSSSYSSGQAPAFGDMIGTALNQAALIANGADGGGSSNGKVPNDTKISLLINNGITQSLTLSGGALTQTSAAPSKLSTPAVLAIGTIGSAAVVAAGVGAFAYATGVSYRQALGTLGSKLLGASRGSGQLLLSAGEKKRRKRR